MRLLQAALTIFVSTCTALWILPASSSVAAILPHAEVQYSHESSPDGGSWSDSTGDELADGVIAAFGGADGGTGDGSEDPLWVGWNSNDAELNFDLVTLSAESAFDLTQIDIRYQYAGIAGIDGPDNLDVYFSTDGGSNFSLTPDATFSSFLQNPPEPFAASVGTALVPVSGSGVTNVRLVFDFSDQWTFLTEVQFDGSPAATGGASSGTPEPSAFVLCFFAMVFTAYSRRTRNK